MSRISEPGQTEVLVEVPGNADLDIFDTGGNYVDSNSSQYNVHTFSGIYHAMIIHTYMVTQIFISLFLFGEILHLLIQNVFPFVNNCYDYVINVPVMIMLYMFQGIQVMILRLNNVC